MHKYIYTCAVDTDHTEHNDNLQYKVNVGNIAENRLQKDSFKDVKKV